MGEEGIQKTLRRVCLAAEQAITWGYQILVLSDRTVSADNVPTSPLLVVSAIHNHLVNKRMRSRAALVVESGEPREVHHFCTLVGYGADAICPYLAFEALHAMQATGKISAKFTRAEIEVRHKPYMHKAHGVCFCIIAFW